MTRKRRNRNERSSPPPKAESRQERDDDDLDLQARLAEIEAGEAADQTTRAYGMLEILASKKRMMMINFLAGMSRGVGFFLGVTLLGGIVLGLIALFFDRAFHTIGMQNITFERVVRSAADKALEIQRIWQEKKAEEVADTDAPPAQQEPAPVEEDDGR